MISNFHRVMFFCEQKTSYEMRISDWSSDVCSSDLPILNVEVENFAGPGPYSGFNGPETTASVNQRLDIGGRRKARMTLADAPLAAQEYRFAIARAEPGQQVRSLFAFGIAVRANLPHARESEERARELSRIARELEIGRAHV